MWSIERDPNHYAQMVLLLIGTLALGTASLALSATNDVGAWETARHDIGGSAQVQATLLDPTTLPEVTSSMSLMKYTTSELEGEPRTTILGIDPIALAAYNPATQALIAPLVDQPAFPLSGIALPADAQTLAVQVYAAPLANITTRLAVEVQNAIGVQVTIPLTTADETLTGVFSPYVANLPTDQVNAPWRLVGVRFLSRADDQANFQHTVYLDALSVTDGAGTTTVLDDFERLAVPEWTATNQGRQGFFVTATRAQAEQGEYSLRVDYVIAERGAQIFEPLLEVQRAPGGENSLPIIVSRDFAEREGRRSDDGDRCRWVIRARRHCVCRRAISTIAMKWSGLVDAFPTMQPGQRYFIARSRPLADDPQPVGYAGQFLCSESKFGSIFRRAPPVPASPTPYAVKPCCTRMTYTMPYAANHCPTRSPGCCLQASGCRWVWGCWISASIWP